MVMEGDLTWGSKHTIQYTDDVLYIELYSGNLYNLKMNKVDLFVLI